MRTISALQGKSVCCCGQGRAKLCSRHPLHGPGRAGPQAAAQPPLHSHSRRPGAHPRLELGHEVLCVGHQPLRRQHLANQLAHQLQPGRVRALQGERERERPQRWGTSEPLSSRELP